MKASFFEFSLSCPPEIVDKIRRVTWIVNGRSIGFSQKPEFLWHVTRGAYTAEAVIHLTGEMVAYPDESGCLSSPLNPVLKQVGLPNSGTNSYTGHLNQKGGRISARPSRGQGQQASWSLPHMAYVIAI